MYALSGPLMVTEPDFDRIYHEHYQKVRNLCAYLLCSRDAAEDAAQEVFVRVRQRIDTYNPEFSFSNWILKVSSNYCMDLLRRRGVEKRLFESDPSEIAEPAAHDPGPLSKIITAEEQKRIRQALLALPEKFRIPLVMTYYNEFDYEEIAAILQIPRNTVATLLFRGKQLLRKRLNEQKRSKQ